MIVGVGHRLLVQCELAFRLCHDVCTDNTPLPGNVGVTYCHKAIHPFQGNLYPALQSYILPEQAFRGSVNKK